MAFSDKEAMLINKNLNQISDSLERITKILEFQTDILHKFTLERYQQIQQTNLVDKIDEILAEMEEGNA